MIAALKLRHAPNSVLFQAITSQGIGFCPIKLCTVSNKILLSAVVRINERLPIIRNVASTKLCISKLPILLHTMVVAVWSFGFHNSLSAAPKSTTEGTPKELKSCCTKLCRQRTKRSLQFANDHNVARGILNKTSP